MKKMWSVAAIGAAFVFGFIARGVVSEPVAHAQSPRVYELRTYTAPDGKLEELHARFRNHTLRIFQKHGMSNVGVLQAAGCAAVTEHADLSDRASEPGSGQAELGRLRQGPRVAEGRAGVTGQREDRRQGRVGVSRCDGLLADEVARGCARRSLGIAVGRESFASRHLHRPGPGAGRRVHALRPHGQRPARASLSDRHLVRHLGVPARADVQPLPAALRIRVQHRHRPPLGFAHAGLAGRLQAAPPVLRCSWCSATRCTSRCSGSCELPSATPEPVAIVSRGRRPAAHWRDLHRGPGPGPDGPLASSVRAGPPFCWRSPRC